YLRNLLSGGRAAVLKAGEYEIRKAASMSAVHATLVEGKSILYKVTLPEGLTSAQIVERLMAEENLTGEIAEIPAEGSLLPDTYRFSRGMSRQELIERMQVEQRKFLAQMWEKRQPNLPVSTPEQALILASIVEKETGRADERHRVAGVFVNRLRKGMRLQSDPTIIYGIVGGKGSLGRPITRSDIDGKTAYNTYQISGLPPGPICNPGRPAIEATLDPAATNDLFFVADGSGGHAFSETLKEHNAAVANWRKVEKQAREEAREEQATTQAPAEAAIPVVPAAGASRAVSRAAPPPVTAEASVDKSPSLPAPLPTVTHLNAAGSNAAASSGTKAKVEASASASAPGVPIPTRKPKR
ncbi:MAG: endolytic transglycosylase MltG, partial [Hyphomicrobiaceae bacterium]